MMGERRKMAAAIAVVLGLTALVVGGCGQTKESGPSYAEALAIYNQEVLALNTLRQERDKLRQALEAPETSNLDVAKQLLGNVADVQDAQKELAGVLEDLGGPGAALADDETDQKQKDLIGAFNRQVDQAEQQQQEKAEKWKTESKAIETQIAKLEGDIAEQQRRVDLAKADKDAAEAARK